MLLGIGACLVASLVLFALAKTFVLALIAYWFIIMTRSLYGPLYENWLNQNTVPQLRATVLSMLNQSNALGQAIGGPMIGAAGTLFSLRAAMMLCGMFFAPALLLYSRALGQGGTVMEQKELQSSAGDSTD
jgi:predicted MFS family arabinose efflux permease